MNMNYVAWIETSRVYFPDVATLQQSLDPFTQWCMFYLLCVKGGAGIDKEGGLDVFTIFGLAWSQDINPGERLMELH